MKKGRRFGAMTLLAAQVLLMLFVTSCRKDEIENHTNLPHTGGNTSYVSAGAIGAVYDVNQHAVANAEVSLGGVKTTTDANGLFQIHDVSVPSNRAMVMVKKPGYFKAFRAFIPKEGASQTVYLTLVENTPAYTVDAQSGGDVNLTNGSGLSFPSSSLVYANGNNYTGTVNIAVQYLAPGDEHFGDLIPGDLAAERADGSEAQLESFGMLNVELTGTSGQPLQVKEGKVVTLTVEVPAALQASAPSTIPLWYFDESLGIWKEEGQATLQGSAYVGNVKHFTWWNCDQPYAPAIIRGRVLDCQGNPVEGAEIKRTDFGITGGTTNGKGEYEVRFPVGMTLDIYAYAWGSSSQTVVVGPLNENEVYTLPDLIISDCPAIIRGKLTSCAGLPVDGTVYFVYDYDPQVSSSHPVMTVHTQNGEYLAQTKPNGNCKITGYTVTGEVSQTMAITTGAAGTVTNVGDLSACITQTDNSFMIDGGVYNHQKIVLIPDYGNDPTATARITTGLTDISVYDPISRNSIFLRIYNNAAGTYNSVNNECVAYFNLADISNENDTVLFTGEDITVTIDQIPQVGDMMYGTFYGTFKNHKDGSMSTISDGQFAVIRKQ